MIRWILIAGLLLALAYAFLQRRKSRLVAVLIYAASIAGIGFVLFPEGTTTIANYLGVGRGADLILYCWIVIGLVVSLNLQLKILELQGAVTKLTRELALRAADDGRSAREQSDARRVKYSPQKRPGHEERTLGR